MGSIRGLLQGGLLQSKAVTPVGPPPAQFHIPKRVKPLRLVATGRPLLGLQSQPSRCALLKLLLSSPGGRRRWCDKALSMPVTPLMSPLFPGSPASSSMQGEHPLHLCCLSVARLRQGSQRQWGKWAWSCPQRWSPGTPACQAGVGGSTTDGL